jgi:hypothetical protein
MSNLDPNFPNGRPPYDPEAINNKPAGGWTLGIGLIAVAVIIGFLAFGNNHHGDTTASAPPGVPTAANPAPAPSNTATLPAAPKSPAETTGSAPTSQ